MMNLSEKERMVLQDFVWTNNSNKDKKAAVQAAVIVVGDKITDKDVPALCRLLRLPVSSSTDMRHAILTAKKLKELQEDDPFKKELPPTPSTPKKRPTLPPKDTDKK